MHVYGGVGSESGDEIWRSHVSEEHLLSFVPPPSPPQYYPASDMSFSVDDLVSSLSSSHISQEAMDLATLQAQLAEALLGGSAAPSPGYSHGRHMPSGHTRSTTQACNTPTGRTPSLSSSCSHSWATEATRKRGNSVSSMYMDDMEEDERMVEDLLIPPSPTLGSVSGQQHFGNPSTSFSSHPQVHVDPNVYPSYEKFTETSPSSPATSLFTSTDPFYIAQLQALNNATPQSQSIFAQNGRLAQNSPFALSQYHTFHSHGQNWEHTSIPIQTAAAF